MFSPDSSQTVERSLESNEGFTLIELMVVVAIVSILAVIAMPAYLDYVTRSKVSEALAFVAEAKTAVTESYYSTRKIPTNNSLAGLAPADNYNQYQYLSKLEILTATADSKPGTIQVTIRLPGSTIDGKYIQLIPSTVGDIYMSWICSTPDLDKNGARLNLIPPSCRGI
jgi:type IV pilus assembly protein PilA